MNPYTRDQEALPVPGVHPSESPTVSIALNEAWIPYLIGALDPLRRASYWAGTTVEIETATQQAEDLIALIGGAT